MVKLPYLFEVLGQGQSKILAKISAVTRSMQCSNKKIFGQDFDRGQRSKYTAYASVTPLYQCLCITTCLHAHVCMPEVIND